MVADSRKLPELASDCSGCGACTNVCASGAVRLKLNNEGFYAPEVDASACLRCQACVRACPQLMPELSALRRDSFPESHPYGAWALDDEVRKTSSSGGVFTILARYILARGGSVYGAAWDKSEPGKKPHLRHIRVTTDEELRLLRGSKYIQSEIGTVYRAVKEDLKKGIPVLFSGTPCQAAALRSCLRKPWENLIVLDVACHGVPSRLLFDAYVREQEQSHAEAISFVDFRNKARGWSPYCVVNHFHSGKASEPQLGEENDFMNGFISDIAMNRACYDCRWAVQPRVADLTLADFWCLHLVHPKPTPEWTNNKGISLVLANTARGEEILQACAPELFLHREKGWKEVQDTNAGIYRHAHYVSELVRDRSLAELAGGLPLSQVLRARVHRRQPMYDVGILGPEQGGEWGAMAAPYALYRALENIGLSAAVLYESGGEVSARMQRFLSAERMAGVSFSREDAYALNERFRAFVTTWCSGRGQQVKDTFSLLDFSVGDKRRVACSLPSNGVAAFPKRLRRRAARLLKRFDAATSADARSGHVVEPLFLLGREEWKRLTLQSAGERGGHLAAVIEAPSPSKIGLLEDASAQTSLPLVDCAAEAADFHRWLQNVADCELLVTDSRIGLCFALIFNRPFILLSNAQEVPSGASELLRAVGAEPCLTPDTTETYAAAQRQPMDWDVANRRLELLHQFAVSWLEQALKAPRPQELERCISRTESALVCRPSRLQALRKRLRARLARLYHRLCG